MASEEEKRRKREQDAKDEAAMRKHAQKKRDDRRERAHQAAAEEEQREINKSDDRAMEDFRGLLGLANTMDNDELDQRVKKWQRKHGGWFFRRGLTGRDKAAIKRAKKIKKKGKGWFS